MEHGACLRLDRDTPLALHLEFVEVLRGRIVPYDVSQLEQSVSQGALA